MITRNNIKQIRTDIENALISVGVKYGIEFDLGRITYDPLNNNLRGKLSAEGKRTVALVDSSVLAAPLTVGTSFRAGSLMFTITKIHLNRPKYKYAAQNTNGTRYLFTGDQIRKHLAQGK